MRGTNANWRTWAFGFLGGALLSALRAPLGLDLLRVIAVDGPTSAAFRAAALLAIAMAVYDARIFAHGVPMLALLASTLVGFLAHALVLDAWTLLGTRSAFAALLIAAALALNALAKSRRTRAAVVAAPEDGPIGGLEVLGLCLAGGGAACAVESVARPLRTLGLGLAEDDTVYGAVFLFALLLGSAAFGGLVPERRRREALAAGLALGALACALGANRLASFADPRVLVGQVESLASLVVFEDEISSPLHANIGHVGTWRVDAVLAASCIFVPALVVGAALGRRAMPKQLAWVLVGAALGLFGLPFALRASAQALDAEALAESAHAATFIGASARVAAVGGALLLLRSTRGVGRLAGFAGTALALAGPSFVAIRDPWLFTPWDEAPKVVPLLAIDAPEGLLTVELARGVRVATLDRVRLTPVADERPGDEDRITRSLALLGEGSSAARVLLVGQLTPERSALFASFGSIRLEYTSPWWRHALEIEESLFEGARPAGELVPLSDAAERLRNGEYDLLIAPPVFGQRLPSLAAQFVPAPARAPRSPGWDVPAGSLAVIWLDAAANLAGTDLGEHVLVSSAPIEEPCVGIVIGTPGGSAELARGARPARGESALSTLRTLAPLRSHTSRSRLFERLADSNAGGAHGESMRFLALHYSAQDESTPFASRDERVEIDPESLAHLRAHALSAAQLDSFSRVLIEDVAVLLTNKRRPDLVREFIVPIAEAHGPWLELDKSVVVALMEFDLDEEVTPRLQDLLAREPYDLRLILLAAEWEEHRGRDEAASAFLERALDIQPNRPDALKRMARLHHRRGSAEAPEWVRKALEATPDDPELLELLAEPTVPSAGDADPSDP